MFFCNKKARTAYETFIVVILHDGHNTSIMWIDHVDAWMSCVIEDLQRGLKGIGRGGKEPHVLKKRYSALVQVATENLHAKCMASPRRSISISGSLFLRLDAELQVNGFTKTSFMLSSKIHCG